MTETAAPTPTGAYASLYPASVVLPDKTVWHRCKVFLTPQGLIVYRAAPIRQGAEVAPDFTSAVNYAATPRLTNDARMGYYVSTAAGQVTITGGGGCGCGNRLRYWVPEWAREVLPWPS